MKSKFKVLLVSLAVAVFSLFSMSSPAAYAAPSTAATKCNKNASFLGIPAWYAYLNVNSREVGNETICVITDADNKPIESFSDLESVIPNVAVAIVDMLLRLAGLIAFIFLIVSGFRFVAAAGDASKEKQARQAAVNAVLGAVIASLAAFVVSFVGKRLLL